MRQEDSGGIQGEGLMDDSKVIDLTNRPADDEPLPQKAVDCPDTLDRIRQIEAEALRRLRGPEAT